MKYEFGLRWILTSLGLALASFLPISLSAAPNTIATDSVYQLQVPLTDQDGRAMELAKWRGQPVLISMFYTSCEFVCPRIVEGLKQTEKEVVAHGGKALPVLLVTFDPERDDAPTLKKTARERNLPPPVWTLAKADAGNVRKLAAILDIQYRKLPSGDFNHTSVLILLDAEGRIAGRTSTIGASDPAFVKLVRETIRKSASK
jgi:protein SCO1/2